MTSSKETDLYEILLEQEAWAMQGRLIPGFTHEVGNSLQAVMGALKLAEEDSNDPRILSLYFNIMRQELQKVCHLITSMHVLNAPLQSDALQAEDAGLALQDVLALLRKELQWHHVHVTVTPFDREARVSVSPKTLRLSLLALLWYLIYPENIPSPTYIQIDFALHETSLEVRFKVDRALINMQTVFSNHTLAASKMIQTQMLRDTFRRSGIDLHCHIDKESEQSNIFLTMPRFKGKQP